MKALLTNVDGYKVFVEKKEVQNPDNLMHIRFLTQFEHAKMPSGEQVKFEMFLTDEQRKILKEIL